MAPVLLGFDAMRRGAAAGSVHPYKMPKVEGTPAVLVTSSLEMFFSGKSKSEKRHKSGDSKKHAKIHCFFFSRLQTSTMIVIQLNLFT